MKEGASPTRIVTADIGGTHARFALATIDGGQVVELTDPVTLPTGEFESFDGAWLEFNRRMDSDSPTDLAVAFAGPVSGEQLKLTNNPWVIRPAVLPQRLGIERFTIVNDFGAVGHAVAGLQESAYRHQCGPDVPLPSAGIITIVGPGTGLGVAALLRRSNGTYEVLETEGGHIDFAPLDPLEDRILAHLRPIFRRVSIERLVSGRGLLNIYAAVSAIQKRPQAIHDDKELWRAALEGTDPIAVAALDRLCLVLGAVAGDLALAQGAGAVVIAGGLGLRLSDHLPRSGFRDRFIAKGRFERRLDEMPVKLLTYAQPGLLGAAMAFAREHLA